jgi:hypothetical protein
MGGWRKRRTRAKETRIARGRAWKVNLIAKRRGSGRQNYPFRENIQGLYLNK